eukprot:4438097-Heterocapsa_arctica.AAC.1
MLMWFRRRKVARAEWESALEATFLEADPFEWSEALQLVFEDYGWTWEEERGIIRSSDCHLSLDESAGKTIDKWITKYWKAKLFADEGRVYKTVRRTGEGLAQGMALGAPRGAEEVE